FANDARPQEWRNRDRAARTDASCSYCFLSSSNLLGRIFSGQRIPANLYHFSKHANPIAQRTDARAFAVCPCNRHFGNLQTELFRQVEQFGIEAPAFHRLQRKNCLRGSTCERLEAALRVPEGEAQRDAQHQIKNSAEQLPVEWLPLALQITAQPARADGHIRAGCNCGKQFFCFFIWGGKIGVSE